MDGDAGAVKTLFVLPNAIGDVICGLGAAHVFREEGPVTWALNPSAAVMAPILEREGFDVVIPPVNRVRRMRQFGASVESAWATADAFLAGLRDRGPYARVVNPHLTRAASLIAGAIECGDYRGPALRNPLVSDPWSDFFIGSVARQIPYDIEAASRFALIAGLPSAVSPRFRSLRSRPENGIVLQPGAGWPSKSLAGAQAARIADCLGALAPVAIIGSPAEKPLLDEIRSLTTKTPASCAPCPLLEALEKISSALCLVTTDTWAMHAAAAMNVPFVALLGPTRFMARGRGIALSPDEEPSYQSRGESGLEKIPEEDVVRAVRALTAGESKGELESARSIAWDCSGELPSPCRPLSVSDKRAERRVFAWARTRAFSRLVEWHEPARPLPRLRTRAEMAGMYARLDEIGSALVSSFADYGAAFPLFATTFPGRDADRTAQEWAELTAEAIRS